MVSKKKKKKKVYIIHRLFKIKVIYIYIFNKSNNRKLIFIMSFIIIISYEKEDKIITKLYII